LTKSLRDAIRRDGRTLYAIARDAGIPYPPLYRFVKGDKDGCKQGLRLTTADKIAETLGLELRPAREDK
jgi:hypothetical protein